MSLYGLFLPVSFLIAVETATAVIFGWEPGTVTRLAVSLAADQ